MARFKRYYEITTSDGRKWRYAKHGWFMRRFLALQDEAEGADRRIAGTISEGVDLGDIPGPISRSYFAFGLTQ